MQTSTSVAVPEELTGREATVVLQVRGRSLRDECLDDGDYVVLARRDQIRDGETAVLVLADGSAQVKSLQHRGENILLHSRRNGGAPLSIPRQDLKVEGVVVGILRRMNPIS
jgi:repressor LexA